MTAGYESIRDPFHNTHEDHPIEVKEAMKRQFSTELFFEFWISKETSLHFVYFSHKLFDWFLE